jgi:Tfp pilus assembly protein PilV
MREIHCRGVLSRLRASLRRARRSIRAEAGFALIEVVVSAGLLMVVAGGVLAGIDGPSAISTKNEVRTQGSALAQQDQERMRAMPVSSLTGYTQTRTVPVAGTNYSVYSRAIWIRDSNDTSSCTVPVDDTSGDYIKITSRVTAPGPGTPVELNSLVSPPPGTSTSANKGDLSIQLKDQLDQPVVGQNVSISGPQSMSVATNSEGCAVFGLINQGTYTVSYSRSGWVDPSAVSNVSFNTSVTAGSSSVVTKNYAQAGTISASVNTSVSGVVSASLAKGVTIVNGGIPTGTLTFPAVPASGSSSYSLAVYPFPSGYGVWAGTCTSGNPTQYGQPAVSAAPGPGASVAVTLRQPSINISTATGVPGYPGGYPIPSGAHMVYTAISAGCTEKYSQTTIAGGKVPQPGVPYGTYKLCGDYTGYYSQLDSFVNQVPGGSAPTISYRGSGVCT